MTLASSFLAEAEQAKSAPASDYAPSLQDEARADADTTAWWVLDVSRARPVIEAIARGEGPVDWVGALLAGVRIADVDWNNVHLLGPYAGRHRMIGALFTDYCPPESWQIGAELILAAVANYPTDAPLARGFTSLAFRNGWARASIDGTNPDLVLVAVGGIPTDDRSLWSVRASEERYRNLFHYMPNALVQVDSRPMRPIFAELRRKGVTDIVRYLDETPDLSLRARRLVEVTDANRSAVELFGAECADQLMGPVAFVFEASPETARRVIAAHFEGLRNFAEVIKLRTFDGRLRDVELSVTYPVPPDRLDITILGFVDITDRLRTEGQLRQLQTDYARAARISMLGELATSITHEVNQPLSAIVTNAETSLRWLARPDPNLPKVKQLTARIAESARRASAIVRRIRDMASRRTPERIPLDLNDVIDEALLFVRHDLEARSIGLSLDLGSRLPRVLGDRVQLQQVVVNLLLNSIQAMAQAGMSNGRIDLGTDVDADGNIVVSIRDQGPGISAESLGRVFDGFFTTKEDGMGIGLAICQSIIGSHGGTIAAANHPQGGALFRFWLPGAPLA